MTNIRTGTKKMTNNLVGSAVLLDSSSGFTCCCCWSLSFWSMAEFCSRSSWTRRDRLAVIGVVLDELMLPDDEDEEDEDDDDGARTAVIPFLGAPSDGVVGAEE